MVIGRALARVAAKTSAAASRHTLICRLRFIRLRLVSHKAARLAPSARAGIGRSPLENERLAPVIGPTVSMRECRDKGHSSVDLVALPSSRAANGARPQSSPEG